jgi:pimeloyl-ACP methyl ester carboxylesterase
VLTGHAPGLLYQLPVPVHVLIGDRDQAIDAPFLHRLSQRHPHVMITTVPGAGHDMPLSHPERSVTAIEDLRRQSRLSSKGEVESPPA